MGRSGYEKSEGVSPRVLFIKIIDLFILFILPKSSLFMCNSGFVLASVRIYAIFFACECKSVSFFKINLSSYLIVIFFNNYCMGIISSDD